MSWITETDTPSWRSAGYEVEIDGRSTGRVDSDESVLVPWPGPALTARSRSRVRVRVWGTDGSESAWSDPLTVEVGLVDPTDWQASWITPAVEDPRDTSSPAPMFRRSFDVADRRIERARLYVTSAGVHQIHLNGGVVGDHVLAPGWSSYKNRLRYDTHDVTSLLTGGENVLGAVVADGWWRGFLKWDMLRNVYGDRLGLFAQLEITYDDGTTDVTVTDEQWRTTTGPFLVRRPLPGRDVRRSARARRMGSPGLRRRVVGAGGAVRARGRAGSSHHRARPCVGSRMLRSARCSPPRPGRRCSTSARTSSAACASR